MGAPILKHAAAAAAGERIWLVAGTGEGPRLAEELLRRRWRVRVSVVSRAAAAAYPQRSGLEMAIGPIGGSPAGGAIEAGIARVLNEALEAGDPFRWVLDATHPYAVRISAALADVCRRRNQPLLRLHRPLLPRGGALVLPGLESLGEATRPGTRLLLAIGARQLAMALRRAPHAVAHARILPHPEALRQALACGLPPERLACLRPSGEGAAVERALCRHWRIDTVLCRRSGGDTERHWHAIGRELGLRLLLLNRPGEPAGVTALPFEALLARIGGRAEADGARVGTPAPPPPPPR
jgi:precorrin-6A/cobalt-precorrin-6A reductase